MNPIRIAGSAFPPLNRPAKPVRSGLPPAGAAMAAASSSGTPVFSESARASSTRPRASSQLGDSGILKNASGSSVTIGSAPIQNMPRQPIPASRRMASSAASRLPKGTPQ